MRRGTMAKNYHKNRELTPQTGTGVQSGQGLTRAGRSACRACSAEVTWARFPDGVVRPIEPCADGAGTVAMQPMLPGIGVHGRVEARIVSGLRTSLRLHMEACPRADLFRARWRNDIECGGCHAIMPALVGGRSVCGPCQRTERQRLAELAGELHGRLGADGARAAIASVLSSTRGRPS